MKKNLKKNRNSVALQGAVKKNLFSEAQHYHNTGDLAAAEKCYKKILKKQPRHAEALHLIGLIQNQRGNNSTALNLMLRSIDIKADEPYFYNNLGLVQCSLQRYEDAENSYQKALKINSQIPSVLANLAALYWKKGEPNSAIDYCKQALHIHPEFEDVKLLMGDIQSGIAQYQEALACYEQILAKNTSSPRAFIGKGHALMELRQYADAANAFRRALLIQPDSVQSHYGLAMCSNLLNDRDQAIRSYMAAFRLQPTNQMIVQAYVSFLSRNGVAAWSKELEQDIHQLLSTEGIDHQDLLSCTTSLLLARDDFQAVLDHFKSEPQPTYQNLSDLKNDVKVLNHPVLLSLLSNTLLTSPELEHVFTAIRKKLLSVYASADTIDDSVSLLKFLCILAQQCLINDYVYYVSDEERPLVEQLTQDVLAELNSSEQISSFKIALLATYKLLFSCFGSANLPIDRLSFKSKEFETLIREHLIEPEIEREILENIPSLTEISDDTSMAVREQYEESPYPRWELIPSIHPSSLEGYVGRSLGSNQSFPDDLTPPEVLVAGCGTGRHAMIVAQHVAHSNVIAVDLSRRSLAYAIRKARSLNINNVQFSQADILAIGDLNRKFDLIESVGVLHHMREPLDGWRILIGLLKPTGVMRIALYSEIARSAVVEMRALIKHEGYGTTNDEIRRFRHDLYRTPESKSTLQKLTPFRDFHNTAECRDLLFHVQEHRYTIPELQDSISKLNLEFVGFTFPDTIILNKYHKQFPDDPNGTCLENWHEFEQANPDTFRAMYNFWVKQK